MTAHRNEENTEWVSCPSGTLQSYARKYQGIRTTRVVVRGLSTVAALLLVTFGTWYIFRASDSPRKSSEPNYGGIVCSEVRKNAKDYLIGAIDETVRTKIDSHLQSCPLCADYLKQSKSEQASLFVDVNRHLVIDYRRLGTQMRAH